jgi:hypothetical protein
VRGPGAASTVADFGAQHVVVDRAGAVEAQANDPVERHQGVAQLDAVAIGLADDPDVGEAAQRHQVVDGLAHLGHDQRFAHPGFDQRQQRCLGHRRPAGNQAHVGEPAAEELGDVGGARRHGHQHQGDGQTPGAAQNVTRFRTSRA